VALEHFEAVERQIRIDARPATVFAFFCEPELMLRWKGVEATLEPVPGGTYRVVMHDPQPSSGATSRSSPRPWWSSRGASPATTPPSRREAAPSR
jgi:uncharacterized protein YndB with AHSA1/START domain